MIKFEIFMVNAHIGFAKYPRPAVVAKLLSDQTAIVYFLSIKDYSERGQSFCIENSHRDFWATGLSATSFSIHPSERIPTSHLGHKRGEMIGELALAFRDWVD
jgi:hypothetical protein